MEIKNTTAYTYDCLMEFNCQYQKKRRFITTVLCSVACVLICLAQFLSLVLHLMGEEPAYDKTSLIVLAVFLIPFAFRLFILPALTKRTVRKQSAMENVTDYLFTEEGFEQSTVSKTHKTQEQCPYSILTSVTESEHYFYLFINPSAAHIVAKDGFTEGNENDFRMLLRMVIEPKKLHIQ